MSNSRRVGLLALLKTPEAGGLEEIALEEVSLKTIANLEKHMSNVRAKDGIEFKVDVEIDSRHLSDTLRLFV